MLIIILITQLLDNSRMSAVGFTYKCANLNIAIFRFVISQAILLFFQRHRIIKKYPTEHFPKKCFSICGSRRSTPQASIHVTRHCETTLLKQKDLINAADTVIARCHLDRHVVYVCVPSQTQGVQWYGGSPSHRSCVASAFHAPRRCASATSW